MEALEKRGQISGGGGAGGGWDSIYENDQSAKVNNIELGIVNKETSIDQFPSSNILRNIIEIECNFPVSISTSKFIDTGQIIRILLFIF